MALTPFDIVNRIYTERKIDWVYQVPENEIDVFMIQRILSMRSDNLPVVEFASEFFDNPDKRQYLALLWSRIPKQDKKPFIPYIKQKTDDNEYQPVLDKIQHILSLSDNDMNAEFDLYIREIEKDKEYWFRKLGMEKEVWKKHGLDFKKGHEPEKKQSDTGLEAFGL